MIALLLMMQALAPDSSVYEPRVFDSKDKARALRLLTVVTPRSSSERVDPPVQLEYDVNAIQRFVDSNDIPYRAFQAAITCKQVVRGRLRRCRVEQIAPDNIKTRQYAFGGISAMKVQKAYSGVDYITVGLGLENSAGMEVRPEPCIALFCVRDGLAPPPPPGGTKH